MVERKLYKTRLCLLYQKGRCSRQYCNFAHGNAEIRRSDDGRQEYRGRDLRESLGRKRSPVRKYSPARDTRRRHLSHGNDHYSVQRKRIDRSQRNKRMVGDFCDNSGSLRMSDRDEDQNKERRQTPSDSQLLLDEQLRQVQSEIMMLDNDKRQLEIFLQEKAQESDTLTLKIHELELQLSKEREEAKRITSKIKKFIKAHNRHLRLQEEMKRSYAQVQKLGEQLDLDAARPGINEEDSKINNVSEDEAGVNHVSLMNEYQFNSSPSKKRSRVYLGAHEASNQEGTAWIGRTRLERYSSKIGQPGITNSSRNQDVDDADNQRGHLAYEDKHRRGIYLPSDITSTEKVPESGHSLPSTGLAAHAVDEVEVGEKFQVIDAATNEAAEDAIFKINLLPYPPPPPPPIPQNAYLQYKGHDEHVDIDDETVEVDII